ncbi:MucR family transcriptional regulator [Methylorubrum extorquens]|uniref:MucR family transcriptional regulator n=1 Tax=Methylorubrum extorquens TaxID=408 RepID=UPI002237D634|nr:MucR family transcriptional regulator [Methylorubrum extorquens]UYW32496.1 MucR family transcriptional regulator [Methylorubrum extorquens]
MSNDNTDDAAAIGVDTVDLTATIVAAYVAKNTLPAKALPGLITSVHEALAGLGGTSATPVAEAEIEKPTPAQIRKSITPDALISFIDGKPYKTLKRHLNTHGLNPHGYRQRYGLPADYPMTASGYSARRAEVARATGLGRHGGRTTAQADTTK